MTHELLFLFHLASSTFGLPPGLLASLCYVESTHNVNAVHHDDGGTDSLGVCQVKQSTAKWMGHGGTEKDLMEPAVNVYYAAKYLAYQGRRYKGNWTRAMVAYNRGNAKDLTRSQYSDKVNKTWGANMFAKGDKIVCCDPGSSPDLTLGRQYTVLAYKANGVIDDQIGIVNDDGILSIYFARRFKPAVLLLDDLAARTTSYVVMTKGKKIHETLNACGFKNIPAHLNEELTTLESYCRQLRAYIDNKKKQESGK
jgi:hypothetical protein